MSAADRWLARAKRLAARVRRSTPAPVSYRDGIPNRADELVAANPRVQELIDAGFLEMGRYSYYPPKIRAFPGERGMARVGAFCSLAEGTQIYLGGNHRTDWVTTYGLRVVFGLPGAYEDGTPTSKGDVVIGNDVWVASGSTILSGVTIGDGAVVGAGSVVSRDVRPYAVVVGNPAREVTRRFSDEQVEALLRIAWWDWPIEQVLEHVAVLCDDDVDGFIERFDPSRQ